jgi:Carboxymuconolactone decarboxylase family
LHSRELREAGESEERIATVSAWRESPYFTESERAALALTEAATRLSDRSDPVPDEIWDGAIIIASLVELAQGHDVGPYGWLTAIGGIAYLAAIIVFRIRG